jgi:hypothetical protein
VAGKRKTGKQKKKEIASCGGRLYSGFLFCFPLFTFPRLKSETKRKREESSFSRRREGLRRALLSVSFVVFLLLSFLHKYNNKTKKRNRD